VLNILPSQVNENEIPLPLLALYQLFCLLWKTVQERAVNTLTYRCTRSLPELKTRSFLQRRLHSAGGAIITSQVLETAKLVWDVKKGEGRKKDICVFDLTR